MTSAGRTLLVALDQHGLEFEAAFWLMDENNGRWHLMLSSRSVKEHGTMAVYKRVDKVLSKLGLQDVLWIGMVSVIGDRTPIVQSLRGVLGAAASVDGTRLDNSFVEGVQIPGCLLYRLSRRQKIQPDPRGA